MPDNPVIERLLKGIKYAESRGEWNPSRAIGDKKLEDKAYGAYQMRDPAFQDVKKFRPEVAKGIESLEQILGNEPLQKAFAAAYLDILINRYGLDEADAVLAYKGGLKDVRAGIITPKTREYGMTALKGMQR